VLTELDQQISDDASLSRERGFWRFVDAKARLARGDVEGASTVIAPRLAEARVPQDPPGPADALVLSEAARIEALQGDRATALADLREAERRLALIWQGVPPQLAEMRARIAALEQQ
jgi:serine/threonine-protein kinase